MIRKFSIPKMIRQLDRDAPDAVWRDFDTMHTHSTEINTSFNQWRDEFYLKMKRKHGDNLEAVTAFQSDFNGPRGTIRVQLVADLITPKKVR